MKKSEALIFLVNSLTQAEKKAFKLSSKKHSITPAYLTLYNIMVKNRNIDPDTLRNQFLKETRTASFDTTVKYLYQIILDILVELRHEQDSYYNLFGQIMKARLLFEKSLFQECFDLLAHVIEESKRFENYYAQLLASRLELEYLLALNFPMVDEKSVLQKHFRINEILNIIRKINEQSSLYELLKYRIEHLGKIRSQEQKLNLNDLVVSEMSIVASSNLESFEIEKLHQLFQANYLISVGDYKSALRSYIELNTLFEKNTHLWDNPPIYYLFNLEGVLDSLRSIKNYDGMEYFIAQLRKINSASTNFNINVLCLIFLYELFPKLDKGDFISALKHIDKYMDPLISKIHLLGITRQSELSLYVSLTHFGNKDFRKANKYINMVLLKGKDFYNMPLYRTIRLVKLMIQYESGEFELISHEIRSIKREMKDFGKGYRIEKAILTFLGRKNLPVTPDKREQLWDKISEEMDQLQHDVFEQQVLHIFNFTAWIESKIRHTPLNEVLKLYVTNLHQY